MDLPTSNDFPGSANPYVEVIPLRPIDLLLLGTKEDYEVPRLESRSYVPPAYSPCGLAYIAQKVLSSKEGGVISPVVEARSPFLEPPLIPAKVFPEFGPVRYFGLSAFQVFGILSAVDDRRTGRLA